MTHLLARADCRRGIPLADGSVHMVCTSPPYYGLRSYLGADDPNKAMEIGGETSVEAYVARMVAVFRDVRRVLHDSGCVFLNLGDSYNSSSQYNNGRSSSAFSEKVKVYNESADGQEWPGHRRLQPGLKPKDLMLVPQRVAIALQSDGWTIRSQIPWVKRASMPESVEDRPSSSVEYVYLLTKKSAYFYDADSVRQVGVGWHPRGDNAKQYRDRFGNYPPAEDQSGRNRRNGDWWFESVGMLLNEVGDPLGLDVNPQGWPGAHFATFPPKLVEPMVLAGTSARGCCPRPGCGAPWMRVVERAKAWRSGEVLANGRDGGLTAQDGMERTGLSHFKYDEWLKANPAVTTGWRPSCSCPSVDPIPCMVLDIFNGSGTTGVVALAHGRRYVGLDLSPEYLAMSKMRVERPHARIRPARDDGPLPLFDASPEDEEET